MYLYWLINYKKYTTHMHLLIIGKVGGKGVREYTGTLSTSQFRYKHKTTQKIVY